MMGVPPTTDRDISPTLGGRRRHTMVMVAGVVPRRGLEDSTPRFGSTAGGTPRSLVRGSVVARTGRTSRPVASKTDCGMMTMNTE